MFHLSRAMFSLKQGRVSAAACIQAAAYCCCSFAHISCPERAGMCVAAQIMPRIMSQGLSHKGRGPAVALGLKASSPTFRKQGWQLQEAGLAAAGMQVHDGVQLHDSQMVVRTAMCGSIAGACRGGRIMQDCPGCAWKQVYMQGAVGPCESAGCCYAYSTSAGCCCSAATTH